MFHGRQFHREKLKPIFYVHGFGDNCSSYVGHCRELASHGHLVLCPDMSDGTCRYTQDRHGAPVKFSSNLDISKKESLQHVLSLRR